MPLSLALHPITLIRSGQSTALQSSTLSVNFDELRSLVLEDDCFEGVTFELVQPGESCRAGPIFDIVEPRAKVPGASPDWPGMLGPPQTAGWGTTHVLQGVAVTVVRERRGQDARGVTGYVLEMSGAPAAMTHYASLRHIIMIPQTRAGLPVHAQQRAWRLAQLKVSVRLAQAGFEHAPAQVQNFDIGDDEGSGNLPRVAYVGQVFSRQRKPEQDESIIYGADTDGMLPVLLHPNEWLDGALLPSYHPSIGGAETYFYQNHQVILELYRRHQAREIHFVGTVATIASANNFDRERNCRFNANLVKWALRADAVALTKSGGGVPHTDLSETARLLETMGIKTAVQVTDLARDHRVESALLFNFPEVDAIVCIGGNDTAWDLPRVDHVVAASPEMTELLTGPLRIESLNVVGVANQQGAAKLRSCIY
jgi:glycine reductase complex component B subunit alpha and beta